MLYSAVGFTNHPSNGGQEIPFFLERQMFHFVVDRGLQTLLTPPKTTQYTEPQGNDP